MLRRVNTIKSYKHYELLQGVARLKLTGEAAAGVELLGVRDAVEHVYANGKYAFSRFTMPI